MTEECTALDGERLVPFRVGNLCKVRVGVRTTPMRRADMFDCAVNASVLTDVLEPSLLTVRKLTEATAENLMLREPDKFRIDSCASSSARRTVHCCRRRSAASRSKGTPSFVI